MDKEITLLDVYQVVVKMQDNMVGVQNNMNTMQNNMNTMQNTMLSMQNTMLSMKTDIRNLDKKIDDTKEELIEYVDKKVDDAKKELRKDIKNSEKNILNKVSDFMRSDVYNDIDKIHTRVTDLEEFSQKHGYVIKVSEESAKYKVD